MAKLAETQKKKLSMVSLGQDQDSFAKKIMLDAMENGSWVLLQNCHVFLSWIPELEVIIENTYPEEDL